MGGRGSGFGGGSTGKGGKKGIEDKSGVYVGTRNMGATKMVTDALGEENTKNVIDYIGGAIENITGTREYLTLELNADATGANGTYAWAELLTGKIALNTNLFKENTKALAKSYADDVKSGWHPKGTNMNDVTVHEMAHRLDATMYLKQGGKITDRNIMMSSKIVPDAIKALKKSGDKRKSYEIQKSLSRYGADFYKNHTGDKYAETFAEAMADYNRNKSRANSLSIAIYNEMKKYL